MPKIVDHDERRRELIAAAWRVIARDGLAATTTRSIARESGYSHGVLAHYFADKDAILDMALEQYFDQAARRIEATVGQHTGIEALREVLKLGLPLDRASILANQVLVNFWGRAAVAAGMRQSHLEGFEAWRTIVRDLVAGAVEVGDMDEALDVDTATDMLVALVDGLGAQAALFPDRYGKRRLIGPVDGALLLLATDAGRARLSRSARSARPGTGRRPARRRAGAASG